MTPASWLRTSSTRRPYSNMFSEMSGGKSMNIHPHKNRKLIYTDGNFHVVYATSRALRSNTKGTAFKTSRHPKRSKRHPTSLLRKSRSHMLRSFNHSYTKGLSHHSPGMSWPIQTRSPDILFFWQPCRYTTDIDSMNIIWRFHTLLNMVIFQLQPNLQLTYYKTPGNLWEMITIQHPAGGFSEFSKCPNWRAVLKFARLCSDTLSPGAKTKHNKASQKLVALATLAALPCVFLPAVEDVGNWNREGWNH